MIRHHPVAVGVLLLAAPLFAVASAESLPSPLGSLMQVALSLGVVLALIWGLAWLVRRVGQVGPAGARVVRQVGGTLVGGRERVVVVEVAGRWLVLGVTSQQVTLLTELDAPLASPPADPAPSSSRNGFAARLADVMARGRSSSSSS
ncbi:flagellar biosynthetic protein FliO [Laribacter hongkongensis]|uniref:flagellar biosynthetic protein FliO n=1 Tax=Laribacter hongkongensis TaxID=168471 RepID=UPI001EFDA7BD|nr:flagellar biosynthetic protein FliO [Laribacter hongkongensis]MCG9031483.1 flagellar biosynthetic protein FliO [Laribacter hongkongensis]MCG9091393.1 flagellar biosynthetic protein FliO [Laribacter hongkongensis]